MTGLKKDQESSYAQAKTTILNLITGERMRKLGLGTKETTKKQ